MLVVQDISEVVAVEVAPVRLEVMVKLVLPQVHRVVLEVMV
tara:strand:+ start:477 stop:599 length:123 start_codon:yes stop_codon:yes gene_type:complete